MSDIPVWDCVLVLSYNCVKTEKKKWKLSIYGIAIKSISIALWGFQMFGRYVMRVHCFGIGFPSLFCSVSRLICFAIIVTKRKKNENTNDRI